MGVEAPQLNLQDEHQWWTEQFDLERIDPTVREPMQRFLLHRKVNYISYALIPDDDFDRGTVEGLDSPRTELAHQIRNTVMRTNVIQGRNIFDFSGRPAITEQTTKEELLNLYRQGAQELFNLFTAQDDQSQNPNIDKVFQWFGNQLTGGQILDRAREHEVGHYFTLTRMLKRSGVARPKEFMLWGV